MPFPFLLGARTRLSVASNLLNRAMALEIFPRQKWPRRSRAEPPKLQVWRFLVPFTLAPSQVTLFHHPKAAFVPGYEQGYPPFQANGMPINRAYYQQPTFNPSAPAFPSQSQPQSSPRLPAKTVHRKHSNHNPRPRPKPSKPRYPTTPLPSMTRSRLHRRPRPFPSRHPACPHSSLRSSQAFNRRPSPLPRHPSTVSPPCRLPCSPGRFPLFLPPKRSLPLRPLTAV